MKTDDVIERLTRNLQPVRPLRHPARRTIEWLAGTTVLLGALVAMKALVSGTPVFGLSPWLAALQLTAVGTSVTAALAAFASVVPGMSRRVIVWPCVSATAWVAGLLLGTFQEGGVTAMQAGAVSEWPCVLMIAICSLPPVIVLARLLHTGAPLAPRLTMALGMLAAAAAANVGACVAQPHTSSWPLLVWHGATVLVLVSAGTLAGPRVLVWPRQHV